jgi:signal transduction histidine kinase
MLKKILIVEDSLVINRHLSVCLVSAGYAVEVAFKLDEAKKLLQKSSFDLVLLDVMLGQEEDGIQLGDEISKNYDYPIIYLTGLSDKATLERAKTTKPYGFIVKPFKENELLAGLEVALHKSEFEREVRRSRDFLSTILGHIDESIFVVNVKNEILYANPPAEKEMGITFEKAYMKSIDEFFIFHLNGFRVKNFDELFKKNHLLDQNYLEILNTAHREKILVGNILLKKFFFPQTNEESILFIYRDFTEKIEKERVLKELRAKNLSLLIEGQEIERMRFSKEIHDGLGQELNLIKLKLDNLSLSASEKSETILLVDSAISEVRRISNNLLPSLINDFDLATCINYLAKQYHNQLSNIRINVTVSDVPNLDLNFKINCFRIVQECITNSLRHGLSKNISIQMYGIENQLQFTIEDDGIGFDPSKIETNTNHNGINIMKQRVESLHGEMHIESNKKLGTLIHFSIPV